MAKGLLDDDGRGVTWQAATYATEATASKALNVTITGLTALTTYDLYCYT